MASKKQIEANRRNAKKSTGPKTEEGKAKSSLNSLKHGLTSQRVWLDEEEEQEFRESMGVGESGVGTLIRESLALLRMVTFFTFVSQEARAWTVPQETAAAQAAGKIHSDIERGFIRAEVVHFDDMVACGSIAEARKRGLLRAEGKTYLVQDGDVITFLFNV